MPLDNVVFWVFAPISIGSAIGMLFQRNAVHVVLFLFVIMLLGVDREETLIEQLRGQRPLAIVLGLGIAVELFFAIRAGVGFATRGHARRGGGRSRSARDGARRVRTPIAYFLILSAALFAIGTVGVLVRRNALVIFMSVELQLNAVNVALVAFSRMHNELDGQVLAFFSMVVAAAEVVVGLAIILNVYRRRHSAIVDDVSVLRG